MIADTRVVYAFGPFRLDTVRNVLTYGSETLRLPDRLFLILWALVRVNGAMVSREELHELVWPGAEVDEHNLAQHVYMLRRLLGERAGDRLYIRTVHNRGYRLIAPVTTVASPYQEPPAPPVAAEELLLRSGLSAFCHYSRGSRLIQIERALSLHSARSAFEAALKVDANYFPALIGLARSHFSLALNGYSSAVLESPRAKHAIARALHQEPGSGVARSLLANVFLFCDWKRRDAKREIDTAVKLSPDSTGVRMDAARIYQWEGDGERALYEIRRALAAEPGSQALQLIFGKSLLYAGSYGDCITHISSLIDGCSEHAAIAYAIRAEAFLLGGDAKSAILDLLLMDVDEADKAVLRLPLLARAYAQNGDVDKAQLIYKMLAKAAATEYVTHSCLLSIALALGDRAAALQHLTSAIELREPQLPLFRHLPWFASLKNETTMKALNKALA